MTDVHEFENLDLLIYGNFRRFQFTVSWNLACS